MKRQTAVVIVAILVELSGAQLVAQSPLSSDPPSRWIPVTANTMETLETLGRVVDVGETHHRVIQLTGEYARNGLGETYERWLKALSPQYRLPSVAFLTDPNAGAKWEIDYQLKNIRRTSLDWKDHPDLAADPMTWKIFLKSHVHDAALGRRTVSGIECVDYRIRGAHSVLKMCTGRKSVLHPRLIFLPSNTNT